MLDPWGALAACLVGAIVGDSAMYLIGRQFGTEILDRHPYWARLLNARREREIEALLEKHGAKMLLLTRFLVGLRSPVYFAAGVLRVKYLRFLITDICCALMVVPLFFGLTYFCGKRIWHWIHNAEVGLTVAVVVAIAAGLMIYFYWVHHRAKALLQQTAGSENPVATASEPKAEVGSRKE